MKKFKEHWIRLGGVSNAESLQIPGEEKPLQSGNRVYVIISSGIRQGINNVALPATDYLLNNYTQLYPTPLLPNSMRGYNFIILPVIRADIFWGDKPEQIRDAIDTAIHEPQHNFSQRWLGHFGRWDDTITQGIENMWNLFSHLRTSPVTCCSKPNKGKAINNLLERILCDCGISYAETTSTP